MRTFRNCRIHHKLMIVAVIVAALVPSTGCRGCFNFASGLASGIAAEFAAKEIDKAANDGGGDTE